MRRLCATFAFAVLSLSVFPARADAYIWAWLDDLSGPRFVGVVVETQFGCTYAKVANDLDTLWALERQIQTLRRFYESRPITTEPGKKYYDQALMFIRGAGPLVTSAREALEEKPKLDVTPEVREGAAEVARRAAEYFQWAQHLQAGGRRRPDQAAQSQTTKTRSGRRAEGSIGGPSFLDSA